MFTSHKIATTYKIGDSPVPFVKIRCIYNGVLYDEIQDFIMSTYPESMVGYIDDCGITTRLETVDDAIDLGIGLEENFNLRYRE